MLKCWHLIMIVKIIQMRWIHVCYVLFIGDFPLFNDQLQIFCVLLIQKLAISSPFTIIHKFCDNTRSIKMIKIQSLRWKCLTNTNWCGKYDVVSLKKEKRIGNIVRKIVFGSDIKQYICQISCYYLLAHHFSPFTMQSAAG